MNIIKSGRQVISCFVLKSEDLRSDKPVEVQMPFAAQVLSVYDDGDHLVVSMLQDASPRVPQVTRRFKAIRYGEDLPPAATKFWGTAVVHGQAMHLLELE